MKWFAILLAITPLTFGGLLRFQCSQLVIERLDPLVAPGQLPSSHLHQIVGGVRKINPSLFHLNLQLTREQNAFNATMDPGKDLPGESTCTSCSFAEDFSNYWTAVLYFKARNGTYKRVPQISQISGGVGGITVYVRPASRKRFSSLFLPLESYLEVPSLLRHSSSFLKPHRRSD